MKSKKNNTANTSHDKVVTTGSSTKSANWLPGINSSKVIKSSPMLLRENSSKKK